MSVHQALDSYFVNDVDAAAISTHRLYDGQQAVTCCRVQRRFSVHVRTVQLAPSTQQMYCRHHVPSSDGKMQWTAATLGTVNNKAKCESLNHLVKITVMAQQLQIKTCQFSGFPILNIISTF